jgi:tRNA(Arg) A34 adenosine deaminase TadA
MSDTHFMRLAIQLAHEARANGADPFGAVLVKDGTVLYKGYDQSVSASDPTAHAELHVIRAYCRETRNYALDGYTLYTSTEPCIMCSGAIHWARISRVVFSVSQAMLQDMTGGTPKPSCESLVNVGGKHVEVVGPLLPQAGLAVFDGYEWIPRAERHAVLYGKSLRVD